MTTGNLKATIEAKPEKATCFVDNAIKRSLESRDITSFQKLLEVMKSGYQESLAQDIDEKIRGK